MIFKRPPKLASLTGLAKYLQADLFAWLKQLTNGMNGRLNFDENFQSFIVRDLEIEAGATAIISNQLNVIPNERIVVKQTGDGVITDGTWDVRALRLVNNGAVSVTIDVRFFHNYRE